MNIIQNLVFPNLDIQAPDDLYVRYWGGTQAFRNEREIRFLQKGAGCVFDTFSTRLPFKLGKTKPISAKLNCVYSVMASF